MNLSGYGNASLDNDTLSRVLWFCDVYNAANPNEQQYLEEITKDDAAWILANAFLILTMQTGFGMLEAGTVCSKNIANIMIKNVVDVSIGGLAYWSMGYGLSFGKGGNAFVGWGDFFVTAKDERTMGTYYARYMFQFSFATAATTIVSGAVAERIKLESYMIYSCLNVFVYCLPARWAWSDGGWLGALGFYDFAGATIVHMNGGASALVAAYMLGPRHGRFGGDEEFGMSSPVTALTGTFMLWWAWLAFNCGSTFGISGTLWKTATKVAVNTINGSIGGSLVGLMLSTGFTWRRGRYFDIPIIICSILGGLVGITCGCSIYTPGESIIIGAIGGFIGVCLMPVMEWLKIDDPVGAVPVHFGSALWSTLAVGIFGQTEFDILTHPRARYGVTHGGGLYLLGVQLLGCVVVASWSMVTTWLAFLLIDKTIGIRMDLHDEIHGADWIEHRVKSESFADKMEKAIDKMHKEGMDKDSDGQAIVQVMQVLLDLMKSPAAQAGANGVIHNFGGAGGGTSRTIQTITRITSATSAATRHHVSSEVAPPSPTVVEGGLEAGAAAMYAEYSGSEGAHSQDVAGEFDERAKKNETTLIQRPGFLARFKRTPSTIGIIDVAPTSKF